MRADALRTGLAAIAVTLAAALAGPVRAAAPVPIEVATYNLRLDLASDG